VSNKREPLSNATSNLSGGGETTKGSTPSYRARPAVSPAFNNGRYQGAWEDPEQPFDFMLELSDVERPPAPKYTRATDNAEPLDELGQSNVVTKPPPPLHSESGPRPEVSERPSAPSYAHEQDWDEVTPRSTSVAAALLSSPSQIEAQPVSSEVDPSSNTPSTEPTGGRHAAPKPQIAASNHTSGVSSVFTLPAPVPFPLTGPDAFPMPTAVSPVVAAAPLAARVNALTSPPFPNSDSAQPANANVVESLTPVSRSEPAPSLGYKFAPSFSIDNAPITTRGTYKREMEARVRDGKKPLSKWVPTVIAAFVLPFIGASMLTSWLESQRRAVGATTEQGFAAHAASPVPSHIDQPPPFPVVQATDPVAAGERGSLAETVTLPRAIGSAAVAGADESATTAAQPSSVHPQGHVKARRALDRVDFKSGDSKAGLTSPAKPTEPSYRVKIPDEQNAPEPRNGAHNVPVNE
jgi:hypothetical protein